MLTVGVGSGVGVEGGVIGGVGVNTGAGAGSGADGVVGTLVSTVISPKAKTGVVGRMTRDNAKVNDIILKEPRAIFIFIFI